MIASSFNLLLLFSLFLSDLSNSEDVTVYLNGTEVLYTDLSSSGPSFASLTTYAEFQSFSVTIPIGVALELGWCRRRRMSRLRCSCRRKFRQVPVPYRLSSARFHSHHAMCLDPLAYIFHLQGGSTLLKASAITDALNLF